MRRWIFLHLAATTIVTGVSLYGGVLLIGLWDDAIVTPCLVTMFLCPVMVVVTAGSKTYSLHQKMAAILVEAAITSVQFLAFLSMTAH